MKDWWKTSAVASFGCIASMLGFWLTSGATYVTRADVSRMIETESPYTSDQRLVLESLNNLSDKLEKNNELINSLNVEIAQLRAKLDQIENN